MEQTLAQLASRLGGRVLGDPELRIARISAIDDSDARALTFATDARYLAAALDSRAGAILTDEALAPHAEPRKPLVLVASTRVALAALLADLEPPRPTGPSQHPSAVVDPAATIGSGVVIGPHVSIGPGASIGDRSVLGAGAVIGAEVTVGSDCLIHPNAVVLDRCRMGDRCVIHAGAVIGADGFGYAFLDGRLMKIPQVGTVELGDDVEIGANACIDRAQTGATTIGSGTKIDNLVMVGHNCRVGSNSAFAAQVGIAGSTSIGDYVRIGGQSGVNGHITVGSRVTIGGGTAVWGDVPDGAFVSGRPARAHRDELRRQVRLEQLPKLFARVDALEGRRKDGSPRD